MLVFTSVFIHVSSSKSVFFIVKKKFYVYFLMCSPHKKVDPMTPTEHHKILLKNSNIIIIYHLFIDILYGPFEDLFDPSMCKKYENSTKISLT